MLHFCSAIQPVCSALIYGIPNYRDCLSAWDSMPFALRPSGDVVSRSFELWSEPQYLLPPFTTVSNRYRPLAINQVPKIWRYSTLKPLLLPQPFVLLKFLAGNWHLLPTLKVACFRHMPPCTHDLRPTQRRPLELTVDCKLEDRLGSDVGTFRMRQPPTPDRSERRLCTIDQ